MKTILFPTPASLRQDNILLCDSVIEKKSRLANTLGNRFLHPQLLQFSRVIGQYVFEALKVCLYFDPAVASGTDPKETVQGCMQRFNYKCIYSNIVTVAKKKKKKVKATSMSDSWLLTDHSGLLASH